MKDLKSEDYEKLGKAFWDAYTKYGFGNINKAEIDFSIYEILCRLNIVDDASSTKMISYQLQTTPQFIKKCKEYRLYSGNIDDNTIKAQVVELVKCACIEKNKIVMMNNIVFPLYLKTLSLKSGSTFNIEVKADVVKFDVPTFLQILSCIGIEIKITEIPDGASAEEVLNTVKEFLKK